MKDVLRIIDPHKLCEDLVIVVDLPGSTVCHGETILHVDESCSVTGRSSTIDGQILLV